MRQNAAGALQKLNESKWSLWIKGGEEDFKRLGSSGDKRAFLPLSHALEHGDDTVRRRAAEALGKLGDSRAVEPLVLMLRDVDHGVRSRAADALGCLGDARAVQPLIESLGDSKGYVRRSAASALRELGEPAWSQWVEGDWEDSKRLGSSGDKRASAPLLRMQEYEKLRDGQAVEHLIGLLHNRSPDTARTLGKMGDARAVEPLIALLDDCDGEVRRSAAWALGEIGDTRAVESLIHALRSVEEFVSEIRRGMGKLARYKEEADVKKDYWVSPVEALAKLDGPEWGGWIEGDEDVLNAALTDGDCNVRWRAALALGQLGDLRAVAPLTKVLEEGDDRMRRCAADVLDRVCGRLDVGLLGASQLAADRLSQVSDGCAVNSLVKALDDSDQTVRWRVATALGILGDARAVEVLITALDSGDSKMRRHAVYSLRNVKDSRATDPLIKALGDRDRDVRRMAVSALEKLGDSRAIEPLIKVLKDDADDEVRRSAATALSNLKGAGAGTSIE